MELIEKLQTLIMKRWGENIEDALAYAKCIVAHAINEEAALSVVMHDCHFNRYTGIENVFDLLREIYDDPAFEDDDDYLSLIASLFDKGKAEVLKVLSKDNWYIENGIAIGLDSAVVGKDSCHA